MFINVKMNDFAFFDILKLTLDLFITAEEVILAEERTTEEEKMHIIEGNGKNGCNCVMRHKKMFSIAARRRAAAKKKKLKNLGKSKSTDTEEDEGEDEQDDGELYFSFLHNLTSFSLISLALIFFIIIYFSSFFPIHLSFMIPINIVCKLNRSEFRS